VLRLQVHLPGQQLIFFNTAGAVADQAERIKATRKTTLTEFFALNDPIKSKLDNG
jgi:hypothetical protein